MKETGSLLSVEYRFFVGVPTSEERSLTRVGRDLTGLSGRNSRFTPLYPHFFVKVRETKRNIIEQKRNGGTLTSTKDKMTPQTRQVSPEVRPDTLVLRLKSDGTPQVGPVGVSK